MHRCTHTNTGAAEKGGEGAAVPVKIIMGEGA